MLEPGDVVLAEVNYVDTKESKMRPAVFIFEEHGNIIIAGITSNTAMHGIPLTISEGAMKNSVIKTNYIFTISAENVKKKLFALSPEKKKILHDELVRKLAVLKN